MKKNNYLTAPLPTPKMPAGIPHILSNEAFERFSFYGMRCILVVFMSQYLMGSGGELNVMSDQESNTYLHYFVAGVYFTPILGAFLSAIWLGKFRTIIIFSAINCLGLLTLVFDDTRMGLKVGLALIAIGSGFIKPCVSANVGDQFGKTNKHLLAKVYSWFYFSINFGSFFSYMLIPILLDKYGPRAAFSVPAASMLLATVSYWVGRKRFVHVPPAGVDSIKEIFGGEGLRAIAKLCIIYAFMIMFWALFDQMDSSWMHLAYNMDRNWLGHEWLPPQIMSANPLMIMVLIPIFSYAIYPAINKVFKLTPLRKISMGLFVAAAAFVVPALIEAGMSELRYDNQVIGQVVFNGKLKNDLRINFDSPTASGAAVKTLMDSIQFGNSSEEPNTAIRTARVTLADASGAVRNNDVIIKINTLLDDQAGISVDGDIVKFTVMGESVDIGSKGFDVSDDADFNGGYLLIHRQENFTSNDTLSINVNSDGDSDVLTGIDRDKPCIAWLILACLILTASEVMVSITVLEFSYTQAPKELKSFIMAISLLSISIGNFFTGTVNIFIQNDNGSSKLPGASYFWFFAGMMLLTAFIFVPVAALYKEKTYILEETPDNE